MKKISCFIRKNTPELRDKLEKMGFIIISAANGGRYLMCMPNSVLYVVDNSNVPPVVIDCGDNEELFLALAALNLHTDEHKIFYAQIMQDVIFAKESDINIEHCVYMRLATVDELIEHFKEK